MRTPEIKEFILKKSNLFWYIPQNKKVDISDELLVETILNYGDLSDFKELERLVGKQNTADIFFKSINLSERRRANYSELTIHFFTHIFKKYAH